MWAEARKTEKQVFKLFDTSAKKKEIARRIQEQNAKEPQDVLMVHGHRMRIYDDVEQETRGISNLTKWQGDESILIDRFDVRNFLESVPKKSAVCFQPKTPEEFIEQMQIEYERYKELVAVDFTGDTEEQILKKIAEKDHKKTMARLDKQRNKGKSGSFNKPTNKKAAIGFVYDNKSEEVEEKSDDEEPPPKKQSFVKPDSGSESSEEEEEELFSAKLGSLVFSSNDWERLNKIAEKYHIPKDSFDKLYDVDRGDELDTAKINEIERERLSISGRGGKRARARLQIRKKLILKDPLNEDAVACLKRFAERRMKTEESEDEDESSDESEFEEKVEFITSFGGEEDVPKKPRTKTVFSVETPKNEDINDQRKLAKLKNRRSESPFGTEWSKPNSSGSQSISEYGKTELKSTTGSRRKSRSPRRSRRSRSPKRERESLSSSPDESPRRKPNNSGWLRARLQNLKKQKDEEADFGRPVVGNKSSSDSDGNIDDDKDLEIRSSMSESEKEKIEIENRKRRIRRTKRELKKRGHLKKMENEEDSETERKAIAARKLKLKLQRNLTKTKKELEQEEREKKLQQEEDEKHRHDSEYLSRKYIARKSPHKSMSTDSDGESLKRRRSRSRSRSRRPRSRSPRSKSRRSRSRSPRRRSPRRRENYRRRSRSRDRDYRRGIRRSSSRDRR